MRESATGKRKRGLSPVVSYRVFFDGDLHSEVPHTGRGGRLQTIKENVTPGVLINTSIISVSTFGVTSAPAAASGEAPLDS